MKLNKLFYLGIVILSLLMCTSALWAQTTRVDFALSAKYEAGSVYLKWNAPLGDTVKHYTVYRGQTSGILAFIRIDSTTKLESIDKPPVSPNVQVFVYYVVATMKNGSLRYSNMVNVNLTDIVRITSKAPEAAQLNVLYTYQVTATTTDPGATLSYQLSVKPEGMTIDPLTGLVKWTPAQKGTYKAVLLVTSSRGGRAEQLFYVIVNGPSGTVAGEVKDVAGKPVSGTIVYLYPKATIGSIQFKGVTDSLGKYAISKVDPGLYLVRAIPGRKDLQEQWFDNVSSAERATPIEVKSNTTTTANFTLAVRNDAVVISSKPAESGIVGTLYSYQVKAASTDPLAVLKYQLLVKPDGMSIESVTGLLTWIPQTKGTFKAALVVTSSRGGRAEQSFGIVVGGPTGTIAGIVTDSLGKPIANVIIRLYQKNTIQWLEIKGVTDAYGKYSIARVDTGSYVARATPPGNFLEQWYDGVATAEQAKFFPVKANETTTINFKLTAKGDVIRITSKPAEIATLNTLYSYQVTATSTDPSAVLNYSLSIKPNGMIIDQATGLIKWTPTVSGAVKVVVAVSSSKGGRVEQPFTVLVKGPTGTVTGIVKDSLGNPLSGIYVRLYKKDAFQILEIKGITGADGNYTILNVDVGNYIARATSSRNDYLEQWYDGSATADQANVFAVTANSAMAISFTMKARVILPWYTVSGTVLDETEKPMKEATVVFTSAGFSLNSGLEAITSDGRIDGTSQYVYKVRVDSTGKYSLKLPQGSYTVMASAYGYVNVFFDGKTDLLTATILKLTKDTTKINFTLKKISSISTGKISGVVVDSALKGLKARVIAYRDPAVKTYSSVPYAYTTDTDSTGAYMFSNLPPGNYIIFALPLGHYTPTFYSTSGPTTSWEKATRIPINGNSVTGITIVVKSLAKAMSGYTSIQGVVAISGGSAVSGSGSLAGAIVYALDNFEEIAGYGITDELGKFFITELAPGSYTLVVDKVNYLSLGSVKANPTYATLSGNGAEPATAFLTLTPISVTDIDDALEVPSGYLLEQNYPNPFNPTTTIRYALPIDSKVTLEVYSVLGKHITTLVDGIQRAGDHQVQFSATSLPSGTYFYSLNVGEYRLTRKLTLIR